MNTINDTHNDLNRDLRALDRQQQDTHDTRIIQIDKYRRHYTTPDTGINAPRLTRSVESHLINTSHATAILTTTIDTPRSTESTQVKYDNWTPPPLNLCFYKPIHQRIYVANTQSSV